MDDDLRQIYEQYQELLKRAAQEQAALGSVSKTTQADINKLGQSIRKTAGAVEYFAIANQKAARAKKDEEEATQQATKRINNLSASAAAFGGAMWTLSKNLAQGNRNFSQFTGAIKAAGNTAAALAALVPGVGIGLSLAVKGMSEALATATEFIDPFQKNYRDLARIGGLAAGGADELRRQFDRLGLVQLPEFIEALTKNSQNIALMGTTVAKGRQQIGDALGSLTERDGPFIRPLTSLGYSLEEITNVSVTYAGILAQNGMRQIKSTTDLTKAMSNYLQEIDLTARATGQSREAVMEQRKQSQADVKFRATQMSMEATQAQQLQALNDALGPLAPLFRATAEGIPQTAEAAGFAAMTNNAMGRAAMAIRRGATAQEAYGMIMQDVARGVQAQQGGLRFGTAGQLGGEQAVIAAMDMLARYQQIGGNTAQIFADAAAEQKGLTAQGAKAGTVTKGLTDASVSIASAAHNMQALAYDALPAAISSVKIFSNALDAAAGTIHRTITGQGGAVMSGGLARGSAGGAFGQNPPPATPGYTAMVQNLESGGRNIQNQMGSNAFGLYQIMPKTYEGLVANAAPGSPLKGTTFEQMKNDLNLQQAAMEALTRENSQRLARSGLSTSDAAKYMTHVLGYGTASRVLGSNDLISLESVIPGLDEKRRLNPKIFADGVTTVGGLKKQFDMITGGKGYMYGGIATGPRGGYLSVLHGTEAVVPLPDGRTIPVSMPADITSGIREQVGLLAAQLSKMDEMVGAMRAQTAMSQKILQHSTS